MLTNVQGRGTIIGMRYIYIMKGGESNYKVGITNDVSARVKAIQTSNHRRIELVTAAPVKAAGKLERVIHSFLAEYRAPGGSEWFELSPEQVVQLCVLINQHPDTVHANDLKLYDVVLKAEQNYDKLYRKLDAVIQLAGFGDQPLIPEEDKTLFQDSAPEPKITAKQVSDEEMLNQAITVIRTEGYASTSMLQRHLRIGYGRAARVMDELERAGLVGGIDGNRRRQVVDA